MKARFQLLLAALPALAAAQTVARVNVTPASPRVVAGQTLQLRAEALDASGRRVPDAVIKFNQVGGNFEGTVDDSGFVAAGAVATIPVTVTAIRGDEKPVITKIDVVVIPGPAARMTLAPKSARLVPRQSLPLAARVYSAAGDLRADAIRWTSSSPAVTVNADGVVTASRAGNAVVTATSGTVRATMNVEVVAAPVASMTITPSSPRARTGDVLRFNLAVRNAAGATITGLTPTWSFAPGHGQIDEDGSFVGYEPGTYTITASVGPHATQAVVTLAPRDVRRTAQVVSTVVRSAFPTSEVWVHPNGKVAYLGTHLGGDRVYVLDVSDPAKPAIVDSVMVNARVINDVMTSEDGKVMVITREGAADRKNGIVLATLDDPLHPKIVGGFTDSVTAGVHSAYIYTQPKFGRHVYLTNDGTGALHIIDINDPANPKQVAMWKTPRADAGRTLHDIDVRDGLLYGSWWNDGLVILDIGSGIKGGSPSNPQFVTQYKYDLNALYKQVESIDGPGFIRGTHTAWRHKNYVFIADEVFAMSEIAKLENKEPSRAYGRLQVLDVSDITNPKSVAYYEPEFGGVHNVWVAGDTLYMGAYNAGFRAFDISGELRGNLAAQQREIVHVNTSDPKGFIPNAAMTWGVVVKNGLAYVNDFHTGLFIVKMLPKSVVVP